MTKREANKTYVPLRPEVELICAAAASRIDDERRGRIESLVGGDLEWGSVLRLACKNEVMLLLYKTLSELGVGVVPGYALDQLRGFYDVTSRVNGRYLKEMFELIDWFQSSSTGVLPYKGPELSAHFYGDTALRRFIDLDMIVREQDVAKAKEILLDRRFALYPELSAAEEKAHLAQDSHLSFFSEDGRAPIEIHWRFVPKHFSFDYDMDGCWTRSESITVDRITLSNLSREDLLVVLAMHGAKHLWRELVLVCDIVEIIGDGEGLDWDLVTSLAELTSSERMLNLSLRLARDLIGAPIPEEVSRRIDRDHDAARLASEMSRRLFSEEDRWLTSPELLSFHVRIRERYRDGVPYAMSHAGGTVRKWFGG